MKQLLKNFLKDLPTFLTAFALATTVWIMAVNATDPVEKRTYPQGIPLEVIGLADDFVITNDIPQEVTISLSAPASLWQTLLDSPQLIRASIDLTGFKEGVYETSVHVKVDARPVKVETIGPATVKVVLEPLYSKYLPIKLIQPSPPAIGYEVGEPVMNFTYATVSGPASLISRVVEIRAILDISQANQDIDRDISLKAYDENGVVVENVFIEPAQIHVKLPVNQRGGYRNVIVVPVVVGQPAPGYQLTNKTVSPLTVTLYSGDPKIINELPGYVETQPLNINGADTNITQSLPLNLPPGVSAVSESTITISITISPIEGTITINDASIELLGLDPEYTAKISPRSVEVILSGPLPILDDLKTSDVRVILDLTELLPGAYQLNPRVQVAISDVLVESVQPETIEVIISAPATATPGK